MKLNKLFITLLTLTSISFLSYADSSESKEKKEISTKVWNVKKYTNIGFVWGQTAPKGLYREDSKFGLSITKGRSFLFPKNNPWGGMVKVGFDVDWMDLSVLKYREINNSQIGDRLESNNEDGDGFSLPNIGHVSLTAGMGIGPRVSIAPFAHKGWQVLVSGYFHYRPSATVYMVTGNDETETSWAYTGMWAFGGTLTWKRIGVGIEGNWGQGNFRNLMDDVMSKMGETDFEKHDKYVRKFAQTRLFLSFRF